MPRMQVPVEFDVGAATHTGCVRSGNEDDYLVMVTDPGTGAVGLLVAVADGMGGVSGGAEASRTAIRSLGASFTQLGEQTVESVLERGFDDACGRVYDLGHSNPGLREMGTTLTASVVLGNELVFGHVGDTRLYRLRKSDLRQLTVDHAMSGSRNLLTRCIGAGQVREEVDIDRAELRSGDLLVLCSDGVWSLLDESEIVRLVKGRAAQIVAERLVRAAVDKGAPDNCTAIVVRILQARPPAGRMHDVEIPAGEVVIDPSNVVGDRRSLRGPRWPWFALAGALILAVLGWLKIAFEVDVFTSFW